jgi:aspartate/methionine/tyrosine aminotransferase
MTIDMQPSRFLPFKNMYDSFSMFADAGKKHGRNFIPISAGVNWANASYSVQNMLHMEIKSSITYRNYGNAGGARPVTDTLEKIECAISGIKGLSIQLTHGATEGAWLLFEYLQNTGRIRPGDKTLMIGHGYPMYGLLSKYFKMFFHEVLGNSQKTTTYLPDIETIQEAITQIKPKVIFLLFPNNPSGEELSKATLTTISKIASANNIFLVIDRVCQMPWDDRSHCMKVLAPEVVAGNAAVVDSLSKSESLAGLRIGYVITNPKVKQELVNIVQARFLNPPVFGSVTLASCRLAEYGSNLTKVALRTLESNLDTIFSEYPRSENYSTLTENITSFSKAYRSELTQRQNRILNNWKRLQDEFSSLVKRSLLLQSGFNCILCLDAMNINSESEDASALCYQYGVGVLTERCFRNSSSDSSYFIRVGLSINEEDFEVALVKLKEYYKL